VFGRRAHRRVSFGQRRHDRLTLGRAQRAGSVARTQQRHGDQRDREDDRDAGKVERIEQGVVARTEPIDDDRHLRVRRSHERIAGGEDQGRRLRQTAMPERAKSAVAARDQHPHVGVRVAAVRNGLNRAQDTGQKAQLTSAVHIEKKPASHTVRTGCAGLGCCAVQFNSRWAGREATHAHAATLDSVNLMPGASSFHTPCAQARTASAPAKLMCRPRTAWAPPQSAPCR
jgi:hypothetical protein